MIVIDIETVPLDTEYLTKFIKYLPGLEKYNAVLNKIKDEEPSQAALSSLQEHQESMVKTASLDPTMGRIISIGCIYKKKSSKKNSTSKEITFCNPDSEKKLLEDFWDWIRADKIQCETITYNGLSFDLPFLFFRSMANQVDSSCWPNMSLRKFSVWPHFDVMSLLTFWGYNKWRTLSHMAYAFGYDCDPLTDEDGTMVYKWYSLGEFEKLKAYNLEDCKKTLFLYQKMKRYYPQPPRARSKYANTAHD